MRLVIDVSSAARPQIVRTLVGVPLREDVMSTWLPATVLEALGVKAYKMVEVQRRDGQVIVRRCGSVLLGIEGRRTVDDVLFAEGDDPAYVGWRALTGVNLRVDERTRTLVDRGPIPVAAVAVG